MTIAIDIDELAVAIADDLSITFDDVHDMQDWRAFPEGWATSIVFQLEAEYGLEAALIAALREKHQQPPH